MMVHNIVLAYNISPSSVHLIFCQRATQLATKTSSASSESNKKWGEAIAIIIKQEGALEGQSAWLSVDQISRTNQLLESNPTPCEKSWLNTVQKKHHAISGIVCYIGMHLFTAGGRPNNFIPLKNRIEWRIVTWKFSIVKEGATRYDFEINLSRHEKHWYFL